MEPEPRAASARAFALPNLAWVAAAVCALAPLLGALSRATHGQLTLHALAVALAIAAVFLVVPAAIAWIAWRLGGGRAALRNAGFFATLAALAFVGGRHVVSETRERNAMVTTQARALATQLVERAAGQPAPPATRANSPPAAGTAALRVIEAQRAVKARLDAVQQVYDDAAAAVAPAAFFELAPLEPAGAIARRREQVQAFARANTLLHEAAALGAFYFSSELRDRAVPEDAVRKAVAIYRSATKKQLPRLKQLRDKDGALALLMDQFLAFAETHRGQWRSELPGGTIAFDSPEVKTRYEHIVRTAHVLEAERRQLRQALLAPTTRSSPERTPHSAQPLRH